MSDLGQVTVRTLYDLWQVDDCWSMPCEGGFEWIGHRLSQKVQARAALRDRLFDLFRVDATVVVVENVSVSVEETWKILGAFNKWASTSALVYDSEERKVVSHCYVYVHEGTRDWRPRHFSGQALLQLCDAEHWADSLASQLHGTVAVASHYMSGVRPSPDDILGCYQDLFCRLHLQETQFQRADHFKDVEELCSQLNLASFGSDETGVGAEADFGNDTALLQLRVDRRHPVLGLGLLGTILLPPGGTQATCVEYASGLNSAELYGNAVTYFTGAWCPHEVPRGPVVAYCTFLPDALYRPGIVKDTFVGLVRRVRCTREIFLPGVAEGDPWKTALERAGLLTVH